MSDPTPLPRRLSFSGADGLELVADGWGSPTAPPVVLLHGGGQTRHAWSRTALALAERGHYAVSLDLRGHGESEWSPHGRYALEAFKDDLRAVVDDLSSPPALIGASLGGLSALIGVGEPPACPARALVLVDVAPRLEPGGAQRILEFMTGHPEGFRSLSEAADAIARYTRHRSRERNLKTLEKNLRRGPDGRYRWHWDPRFVSRTGPEELRDPSRLLRAAGSLRIPTLLVRGRESDVLSHDGVAEFLAVVPHAEFADVSGAGHMVAGDRNDAFSEAVIGFLERHSAADRS
ncbi:MAG: alpha/beta fold hydrolase [Myxococcota bacterium]